MKDEQINRVSSITQETDIVFKNILNNVFKAFSQLNEKVYYLKTRKLEVREQFQKLRIRTWLSLKISVIRENIHAHIYTRSLYDIKLNVV